MSPEERRRNARRVLEDPAILQILNDLEADAIGAFTSSDLSDVPLREIAFHMHRGVQQIRQVLDNWTRTPT